MVIYGTLAGVAIAVLLATLNIFRRAASPQIVELGRVAGTTHFANLERWTDASRVEGVAVLRFSGPLFFANAGALRDRILELVDAPDLRAVVVDMRAISDIDITAVEVLARLVERLDAAGVSLMLVRTSKAVRTELVAGGLGDRLAVDAPVAVSVAEAIEHLGLDLDRVADVVQGQARDAEQRAEAEPIVVAHRFAITRSTVARTAVAIVGLALIVVAGAILLRPTPARARRRRSLDRSPCPTSSGCSELRAEAVVTDAGLDYGDPVTVRLPDRPRAPSSARIRARARPSSRARRSWPRSQRVAQLVVVPDLVGLERGRGARRVDIQVGLRLTGVEDVAAPTVPAGRVIESTPAAGTMVAVGSGVDITSPHRPTPREPQSTSGADGQPLRRRQGSPRARIGRRG